MNLYDIRCRSACSLHGNGHAANLEENEKVKAELAPTKINEPKTPFHAPFSEEEDVDADVDLQDGESSSAI